MLTLTISLAACDFDASSASPEAPRSPVGAIEAEPQRQGDANAGYEAVLNEPYVSCGMPYRAFTKAFGKPPPETLIAGRPGRNAALPYNFTAYTTGDGVELAVLNCLTCHGGSFNGKLIIGLGNEALDLTRDPSIGAESVGAYVEEPAEIRHWQKWADRIATIAPYVVTDTIGVNSAINLTWALIAHRDPKTLAWSSEPLIEPPPTKPLPVSVPPWWRMKKKNAMFYTSAGRGDHARHMILASLLCTDSVEEARAIDQYAPDIRAFIASLDPPRYPFAIDRPLARQGQRVFETHCSRCHGTYTPDGHYPNLVIALEEIGTDPALAISATDGSEDRFSAWVAQSFYGESTRAAPARGYVAPPLDGVWATAPFLHNGSVPTIGTLLDSVSRPTYWTRTFDSTDFDQSNLGWHYQPLDEGKSKANEPEQNRRIYDTTLPGYANTGHTFGDGLKPAERHAVLEYLKTL